MSVSDGENKRPRFYVCDMTVSVAGLHPSQIITQKRRLLVEPSLIRKSSDGYRNDTRLR